MKNKIFALLATILCLTLLLVSCGECEHVDEDQNNICDKCEAVVKCVHTDADNNDVCDACGVAVVKVEVPKEISDLVIKPIPEGSGTLTDYALGTYPSNSVSINAATEVVIDMENMKGDPDIIQDGETLILAYAVEKETTAATDTAPARYTTTYFVYDAYNNNVLYTASTGEYERNSGPAKDYEIAINKFGFVVASYEMTKVPVTPATDPVTYYPESNCSFAINYYTYADVANPFFTETKNFVRPTEIDEIDEYRDNLMAYQMELGAKLNAIKEAPEVENGIYYLEIEDTTYAIDAETCKFLTKGDSLTFVKRPVFTSTKGNIAYVDAGNAVYIYDITNWFECIYVYEKPQGQSPMSDLNNWFVLDNGNVFTQSINMLDSNAKKYDFMMVIYKFDVVYTLIDVTAKTETEVDFGYIVGNCANGDVLDTLYKDGIENVMTAFKIVDGQIDMSEPIALIVKNDLTIEAGFDTTPVFGQQNLLTIVGDNRYVTWFKYGADDAYEWAIVNEKLEIVTYLPAPYFQNVNLGDYQAIAQTKDNVTYRDGFIVYDGVVYNMDMQKLLEFGTHGEKDVYVLESPDTVPTANGFAGLNYFILSKTVEVANAEDPDNPTLVTTYYYYDPAQHGSTPKEISGDIEQLNNMYFTLKVEHKTANPEDENNPIITYTYDIYNENGVLIAGGFDEIENIGPVGEPTAENIDGFYLMIAGTKTVTETVEGVEVPKQVNKMYIAKAYSPLG